MWFEDRFYEFLATVAHRRPGQTVFLLRNGEYVEGDLIPPREELPEWFGLPQTEVELCVDILRQFCDRGVFREDFRGEITCDTKTQSLSVTIEPRPFKTGKGRTILRLETPLKPKF